MKQMVIVRNGPPAKGLRLEEAPAPVPGPGQLRLRVQAAGVNFADTLARRGLYPDAPPLPYVPGYEAAGLVDALGPPAPGAAAPPFRVGDPVLAVADGVISFAGSKSGYGHTIEVDHGNGYVTRYAHNSRLTVKAGDLVRAGQQVAKAGSSGRSTGAHVHFEVWEHGNVVNPRKFLADGRAPVAKRGHG
jgi:NADPH:quinone reductase-like Zn-dependent oxidoreductase